MNVLVTGVTGFVGQFLADDLMVRGHKVRGATRGSPAVPVSGVEYVRVGNLGANTVWREALDGVDGVVHCAARVHVMDELAADPLAVFRAVNLEGTLALARQAAMAGARRFVLISSIKVNGEGRPAPYAEDDPPAPQDAYAISKWEAELGLIRIAEETGLEVVILRPPLVYGPGVGANFQRLMRCVEKGWPLPLGRVTNCRSLLYLGNLTDAIQVCLEHPAAANRTYLLSDGEDVSTPELVRHLALVMGRPARLLPVPQAWFALAGGLLGKRQEVDRLLGSLVVDSSRIRRELGWIPPYDLDAGLAETARHYLQSRMEASPASR